MDPPFALATESKALSVVATNATTICFVFLNLIQKTKKEILLKIKFIFDDHIKRDEELLKFFVPFSVSLFDFVKKASFQVSL